MSVQLQRNHNTLYAWWPYLVASIGIFLTLFIWLYIPNTNPITDTHPTVILLLGVCVSLLIGFALRLMQLTLEGKKSYEIINENFKKEMADRIHAEEVKQQLEKALLQGQKLQAMGTLAGGIAHDFNNILYAIIGYVELSREDLPKESLIYQNLGKVLEGCKRGQDLIARILAFTRRQHHDFKGINLKETIEGVLALLQPTIPASVTIDFKSEAGNPIVFADQTQLHQVLVNVINNAVDAMDGEGLINIHLSVIGSTDKIFSQFPDVLECNYCKIEIKDNGHGMDQTTMSRMFEPFYTTKEVGKGTGLGLATAHTIIQEHKGEVSVKSRLGHGTTFIILLPEYTRNGENNG